MKKFTGDSCKVYVKKVHVFHTHCITLHTGVVYTYTPHTNTSHGRGVYILILGGWMGFIVGMIFVLSDSVGTDSLGPGMSASAVTLLYGYIGGYLIEAFYEK